MDLATARRVYDGDRTDPDWIAAYKVIQWNDIWRSELVDIEPLVPGEPVVLDDDED